MADVGFSQQMRRNGESSSMDDCHREQLEVVPTGKTGCLVYRVSCVWELHIYLAPPVYGFRTSSIFISFPSSQASKTNNSITSLILRIKFNSHLHRLPFLILESYSRIRFLISNDSRVWVFRRCDFCVGEWLEEEEEEEMGRDGGHIVPVVVDTQAALLKKTAVNRSWIKLDCTGEGTILDVDKYAIMHRVQIHARDLRILDPLLSYPSTILGREKAIVLNLEHIKAIITAEEVLLRDPLEDNVIPIVEELRRRLPPINAIQQGQEDGKEHTSGQNDVDVGEEDESPFEFRALEVALEAICSYLDARTTELETAAYPALDELTSKISSRNLDRVRKLKSAMTRLTARVQKVRDELEQLLDDDDDMADLYLSRKLAGASSPVSGSGMWGPSSPTLVSKMSRASRASAATIRGDENDVEELEMLLEAYFMQVDGTLNKLTTLREYIDDTEDYINIQLDNHRNQLIQLELFLSSGTVCLSIYSLVAAIFGMNIPYTWNDNHGYMFKWVVILSGISCAVLFVLIISYARHKGLVGS